MMRIKAAVIRIKGYKVKSTSLMLLCLSAGLLFALPASAEVENDSMPARQKQEESKTPSIEVDTTGHYQDQWVSTDPGIGDGYWSNGQWVLNSPTGQGYWQNGQWISTDPNAIGSGYWQFGQWSDRPDNEADVEIKNVE